MVILYLTCVNDGEAQKIANALLEKRLIACARRLPVSSSYWWDGKINHDDEVLLMMESLEAKFGDIEKVVDGLHSYDTYVLTMVKVDKTTKGVHSWLGENLNHNSL